MEINNKEELIEKLKEEINLIINTLRDESEKILIEEIKNSLEYEGK
jgi:predicted RNase H-like HicB family nuclease